MTTETKLNRFTLAMMLVMVFVSLASLFGGSIAGISMLVGLIAFVITRSNNSDVASRKALDFSSIMPGLKQKHIWLWILLPLVMNALCLWGAKLLLPAYIEHISARIDAALGFSQLVLVTVQLGLSALGEEIAWRAFFQSQLSKLQSPLIAIIVTSIIFALGHATAGSFGVVVYDLFFVFINSLIYGWIFYKTNSAWVSGLAHFFANLFAIVLLPAFL